MINDYAIDEFFTSNSAFLGGLAIFFIIFMIIIAIVCIVFAILHIIGTWKILEKASVPGWHAIIPYYNTFELCNITGIRPIWVIVTLILSFGGGALSCFINSVHLFPPIHILTSIISMLSFSLIIYFDIILNISLARSFGKEDTFAIGLILLPPIFYLILGLDASKYLGPKPIKDGIYDFVDSKVDLSCFGSLTKSSTKETKGEFVKKCPLCGTKNPDKSKFCSACGSKI